MPDWTLTPRSPEVEEKLNTVIDELRAGIMADTYSFTNIEEGDIMVHLLKCPYRSADPKAADVLLEGKTCPNPVVEAAVNDMRNGIAERLSDMGFSVRNGAEVWIEFVSGAWGWVLDGQLIDQVDHAPQVGHGLRHIALADLFPEGSEDIAAGMLDDVIKLARSKTNEAEPRALVVKYYVRAQLIQMGVNRKNGYDVILRQTVDDGIQTLVASRNIDASGEEAWQLKNWLMTVFRGSVSMDSATIQGLVSLAMDAIKQADQELVGTD